MIMYIARRNVSGRNSRIKHFDVFRTILKGVPLVHPCGKLVLFEDQPCPLAPPCLISCLYLLKDIQPSQIPNFVTLFSPIAVVITVGPACQTVDSLCELLEAGATCARIDLTWAPIEYHRLSLQNLNEAMRRTRRLCAVMLDSLGREIMIRRKYGVDESGWPGIFDQLEIEAGQRITITTDPNAECTDTIFPVTYPKFPAMCQEGDSIFVGRYLVTGAENSSLFMEVEEVNATEVICLAKNGCHLDGLLTIFHQERSTEGLSNLQNDLPCLTDFDRQAIQVLASEFEIDFVSLSYCRSPDDINEAREFLTSIGQDHTKVIAKCETRQSLMNFRSLAHSSDGVIISRGNLGLDVNVEKMAMVQKAMASTCAILGKPALITRVCDTMVSTPRPTRAEATDIANAVLDGVDGILLGAETYRGKYGLETVRTAVAICREAEDVFDHENHFEHLAVESEYTLMATKDANDTDTDSAPSRTGLNRTLSQTSFSSEANIGFAFSSANLTRVGSGTRLGPGGGHISYSQKLESIAGAAVKTADKVGAALIIVVTYSGKTASLVAKYRPQQPIMTLVVPYLKRDGMKWILEGRSTARQSLITYGLMPVLAAPAPSAGEGLIEEAVVMAAQNGIVKPNDHVVILSRTANKEFILKVVSLDEQATGIKNIRPKSLLELLKATGQHVEDEEDDGGGLQQRHSVLLGSTNSFVVKPSEFKANGAVPNGASH
jgi:pyruvate kinase